MNITKESPDHDSIGFSFDINFDRTLEFKQYVYLLSSFTLNGIHMEYVDVFAYVVNNDDKDY